jgi:23S rRNA (cytosine1962-C5)-methyltransferase
MSSSTPAIRRFTSVIVAHPSLAVVDDLAVDDYELLDVGRGARLERFGSRVVVRPLPEATGAHRDAALWRAASLRYDPDGGWSGRDAASIWQMDIAGLRVELRPTAAGQVGLFPEQASSWAWLRDRVSPGVRVLNLFGYTGVATLVAAAAGASITHVDASRPTVGWARRNAELSSLADRPIRWIVDDAATFVGRELRRGRGYDGVLLDPPSYGHGSAGQPWRIEADLAPLLDRCAELVGNSDGFVLLTAHTPGIGQDRLAETLAASLRAPLADVDRGPLQLTALTGAVLEVGAFARWPGARS